MNATVYSTPGCVQCNATYRALDKKGLAYKSVDTTLDPEARDRVVGLGYMKAPVVVLERDSEIVDHWSGYNPEKIEEFALAVKSV